ncbi:hypothetical protein T492DRAFT_865512 [Pavlovales sp. CCMP2436]|nr:hypothetical protein T492DRAFT_865512 [Pavlovales sp. CCMP2436]
MFELQPLPDVLPSGLLKLYVVATGFFSWAENLESAPFKRESGRRLEPRPHMAFNSASPWKPTPAAHPQPLVPRAADENAEQPLTKAQWVLLHQAFRASTTTNPNRRSDVDAEHCATGSAVLEETVGPLPLAVRAWLQRKRRAPGLTWDKLSERLSALAPADPAPLPPPSSGGPSGEGAVTAVPGVPQMPTGALLPLRSAELELDSPEQPEWQGGEWKGLSEGVRA